jgi:hypothetical protein
MQRPRDWAQQGERRLQLAAKGLQTEDFFLILVIFLFI